MTLSKPERRVLTTFTSEQWSGRPSHGGFSRLIGNGLMGLVLCLILMIPVPFLRNAGAVFLFTAVFAILFTTVSIKSKSSSEKAFLQELTAEVNETILQLTGNPKDQLSVEDFRRLIESGENLPLPINGLSGLDLRVIQKRTQQVREPGVNRNANVITTTRVVLTVTPPDYGIASFDRLLAAAKDM
jgi:hypothetical protein